ncbi:major facilitator superfamily transporter [Ceratobasidium sp. AG-Ba]|nr:major facilitator superfamily transporter [Ceratobasidium sp. AG-Ba]
MVSSSDIEKRNSQGAEVEVVSVERDHEEGVDSIYDMKSELVNRCFQNEIGMGRYQWELFLLSGFGWMADNIWLQGVAIILPSISREMQPPHIAFATLALYVGLIVGATTWGVLADIIGRRLSWNITLFLSGVFGIAAGGRTIFLPVDGALFLEFIPGSHQWLLTLLSAWWFGQLVASLIAWGFISNYSCAGDTTEPCLANENRGWRYTFYTLESPKYLLAKGRDQEALEVLQYVANRNGRMLSLTIDDFETINKLGARVETAPAHSNLQVVRNAFTSFDMSHVKPLFSTPKLALNTSLTIACWGLIGLAYPLYNAFLPIYLSQRSVSQGSDSIDETYRTYSIVSVLGIPGSIIACLMVDWTRGGGKWAFGGRKFAMASATCLTGIFLFLFTQAKNSAGVLGFNCASALTQNAMYGVLYAYTPEVFPAPHRGTGDAICSAVNRILGLMAPIIATYGDLTSNAPLFVAASLFIVTSLLMMFLPIETAGRSAI